MESQHSTQQSQVSSRHTNRTHLVRKKLHTTASLSSHFDFFSVAKNYFASPTSIDLAGPPATTTHHACVASCHHDDVISLLLEQFYANRSAETQRPGTLSDRAMRQKVLQVTNFVSLRRRHLVLEVSEKL